MRLLCVVFLVGGLALGSVAAFSSLSLSLSSPLLRSSPVPSASSLSLTTTTKTDSRLLATSPGSSDGDSKTVLVVSPPGGIGEAAAVKAACTGSLVRWFVVSRSEEDGAIKLASSSLQQIANVNGELELAGATVQELLEGGTDSLTAVSSWCGSADSLVCCYDGCDETLTPDGQNVHQAAVRLAVKQATSGNSITGTRIVVLPADAEVTAAVQDNGDGESGVGGLLKSLNPFGKNSAKVPSSLLNAVASSSASSVCTLRHGSLFGVPESSPDFSPLVGGLMRNPVLSEEYTMRTVRMDPFLFRNNLMAQIRSCRQTVGEAAAFIAIGKLAGPQQPITVASQPGSEDFSFDQWQAEMERVQKQLASGKTSTLFTQDMIVDDTERLTEWLASKWAPAVLRTYDIAAIRIGARPVYATKTAPNQVEIVWQELVDFDTVTVGRMVLEITKDGVTATRVGGDASKGYGDVSVTPLNGEDVLVRRLAEGTAQAMDKGLAKRIKLKKPVAPKPVAVTPVTTTTASGNVEPASEAESASGPRSAGARRSTRRKRRGS